MSDARRCGLCRQPGHRRETCTTGPVAAPLTVDVEDWLFLVERVARRIAKRLPPGVPFDDLISAGYLGLTEAGSRFDLRKGGSFAAFAEPRIRGAILDDLRGKDSLSRDMRTLSKKLRNAAASVQGETGQAAAADEVAAKLGIGVDELHAQQQKSSAGAVVVGIEDALIAVARVPDARAPDPFEEAARAELRENLSAAVQGLPERMAQVLTMRYGQGMTLAAIGAALGCSESRACQIEGEAVARLRFRGAETDLTDLVPEEVAAAEAPVYTETAIPAQEPATIGRRRDAPNAPASPKVADEWTRGQDRRRVESRLLMKRHLRVLDDAPANDGEPLRPRTRGDCQDGPRPCPWVSCRYHLALDVTPSGSIRHNFPGLDVDEMPATCALDVADGGGATLERVGQLVAVTRERIRQVETVALRKVKNAADGGRIEDAPERFHSPLGAEMAEG